jgi:hypothetical protein
MTPELLSQCATPSAPICLAEVPEIFSGHPLCFSGGRT